MNEINGQVQIKMNFLLSSLNRTQKMGLAAVLISVVVLCFLQNPFDGYVIDREKNWTEKQIKPNTCTKEEVDESKSLYYASLDFDVYVKYFGPVSGSENWTVADKWNWQKRRLARGRELDEKCFDEVHFSDVEFLDFSDWRSKNPIVSWLGSVVHLLGAIASAFVSLVIWLFVFKA